MSDDRGPDPHDRERPAPSSPAPSGDLQVPPQRQPTPPPPPTAPGGPPARPPYEVVARPIPRPEPSRGERFTSWWSRPSTILIFVLVLVLLLVSTTVFATLAITGGSPTAAETSTSPSPSASASPTPGPAVTTETPEPPGAPTGSAEPSGPGVSGSAAPGGGINLPPTPADAIGARFQGGTHEEKFPGPERGYDFDEAREVYVGDHFDGLDGDAVVTRFGLVGLNGMGFAPSRSARPRLGDCASTPRPEWVLDIPVAQLKANTTYCLTTTDGRYGYVTVQGVQKNNAGQLTYLTFIFLVWEGPND